MQVIFVAFETFRTPRGADILIEAWKQTLQAWQKEVVTHLKGDPGQSEW